MSPRGALPQHKICSKTSTTSTKSRSNTVKEMALCISSTTLAFFVAASVLIVNLPTLPSNKSLTPGPPSRRLTYLGPARRPAGIPQGASRLESRPDDGKELVRQRPDGSEPDPRSLLREHRPARSPLLPSHGGEPTHRRVASLRFEFNLSALEQTATSPPAASEPSYKILRISTTTAGGALDGRDGNPAALIPYWSPCSSAARARTPGIGTRVFKLGSFTRPTRARASPPTSTALFRSMRARV